MVEVIPDMPPGTIGFRSSGELTAEDYRDTMVPPLRAAVERGDKVRLLFEIGHGFKETAGGLREDVKAGVSLGLGHLSAWERTALVSDLDWARHAVKLSAWLAPGELRHFGSAELEDAKRWVAGDSE